MIPEGTRVTIDMAVIISTRFVPGIALSLKPHPFFIDTFQPNETPYFFGDYMESEWYFSNSYHTATTTATAIATTANPTTTGATPATAAAAQQPTAATARNDLLEHYSQPELLHSPTEQRCAT